MSRIETVSHNYYCDKCGRETPYEPPRSYFVECNPKVETFMRGAIENKIEHKDAVYITFSFGGKYGLQETTELCLPCQIECLEKTVLQIKEKQKSSEWWESPREEKR